VRHKNTPEFIDHNLKADYQILTNFGANILDRTGHQMAFYVVISPIVCFCTTWRKQDKWSITFLFSVVYLFDKHNTHL